MSSIKYHIILVFSLWCYGFSFGQNSSNFTHFSPQLNNEYVSVSMTSQDAIGNMWMLCSYGVLKYDGYDYKLLKSGGLFDKWQPTDKINHILADHEHHIWLTTESGLVSRYSSVNDTYEDISSLIDAPLNKIRAKEDAIWLLTNTNTLYKYSSSGIQEIATLFNNDSQIKSIVDIDLTDNGELFFSTSQGKVYQYILASEALNEIVGPFTDFPGGLILAIDKHNKLWIGTETLGLFVYNTHKKTFIQDTFFGEEKFNINKEMFLTLFIDSHGYLWGGTDGGGLYKIDSNHGKIDLFSKNDANEFSLGSNTILNLSEDSHNNIWIATNYGKLNVLPFKNNNINYHSGSINKTPQRILSIYKSSKGLLWLGTDGAGLTKIIRNHENEIIEESQFFDSKGLSKGFYVQTIAEDSNANIWFGTYKNGLFFHDTERNTFKKINIFNSKQQEGTDVRTVFKDSKGRIWVGSNVSLHVFSGDRKLLARFDYNTHNLESSIPQSIVEDKNGAIWFGMFQNGLFKLNEDPDDLNASTFIKQPDIDQNISDTSKGIKCVALGSPNELWLVTNPGKLLKYNTLSKTYRTLENLESADPGSIASIIVDNNILWFSSNNGITSFDTKKATAKKYYSTDGLQDNMFLSRSAFKDRDGLMYFGGIKGVNYFDPKILNKKESLAELYINEIEILNQPIASLIPEQEINGIYNIDSLILKNNQSSFSFRFSAIDNILNTKYYYAYRLKGFDKDWITNHPERVATYTNIPPGDYTFEVKAGSKKNSWNIPAKQINISIAPPLWNTPLAYIAYLTLLALVSYGIQRWYLLRKKLFLEKVNHKKENELHELKMNFFAKMSHEIQTPITLILGPIEDMLGRAEQNGNLLLKQRLDIISNNVKRLSKIARELTLVRNKELNRLKLIITKNNVFNDIQDISLSFKELARNKHIDFAINSPKLLFDTWYDREKLEHVIYNLLSNAFKFTPKEGYVQLSVVPTNSKKKIKISVTDSGPGIPKEELNTIFELFYQSKIGKKNKGSGIGLALTKELIDLHKGKIEVMSVPSEGTTFTVTIPITESAYTESERIITTDSEVPDHNAHMEINGLNKDEELNTNKKTILIVEDNYELQAFLKELMIPLYNITLAENGEEGFHYAKNNVPDLILSDIMMPKLDGIEMCKNLQKDNLTKHIPIILLTAKNSTNSKILGLKSGAIEYINKPFNTNELLLKIKNIISSKEHIISKYRKETISQPEVLLDKSQDEIFLENLVSSINSRIDQANFKIEELADALNMSYSSLYRKCQTLTGHSPVDFVRLLRLKKAAILITKYGYNISETSFMTGFNDPKYFSKCFKKYFKKTPGNFKKEAQEMGTTDYLKKHKLNETL